MASFTHKSGRGQIQFTHARKRRTLRLGKCTKAQGRQVNVHVEQLVAARRTGHVTDPKTQAWVRDISDELHDRLAALDLVDRRASAELGPFIDRFIKDRSPEFKPATVLAWQYGKKTMVEFFGQDRDLRSLSEGDAQAYRAWLIGRGMAEATVRRRCAHAKNMLGYAVRLRLIEDNPFGNKAVPTASPRGREKYFVDADLAHRITDNLPDARWRLIWALARWGGFRVPSEIAALTWACVDWDRRRLTIKSPKTERHDGLEARQIPIFAEIAEPLADWWDQAAPGEAQVFPGTSVNGAAYRSTLARAIQNAGGTLWPKLWTAALASRDTELRGRHPGHVVSAWLGHSDAVARKHFLQVTDNHFEEALHNPTHVIGVRGRHAVSDPKEKDSQASVDAIESQKVGPQGLERSAVNACVHKLLMIRAKSRAAKSDVIDPNTHFEQFLALDPVNQHAVVLFTAHLAKESHAER